RRWGWCSTTIASNGLPRRSAVGHPAVSAGGLEPAGGPKNNGTAAKIPFSGLAAAQNGCLKFNRPFEKRDGQRDGIMQHQATQQTGLVKYLAQTNLAPKSLVPKHEAPLLKRFVGKLVVDVLPATFVSVLGGFIITQYQFNHTAVSRPATEQVVPASAEMMQLVRDEHAVIIGYLQTQMAAEKN